MRGHLIVQNQKWPKIATWSGQWIQVDFMRAKNTWIFHPPESLLYLSSLVLTVYHICITKYKNSVEIFMKITEEFELCCKKLFKVLILASERTQKGIASKWDQGTLWDFSKGRS